MAIKVHLVADEYVSGALVSIFSCRTVCLDGLRINYSAQVHGDEDSDMNEALWFKAVLC